MTINGIAYALVRDYSERTKLMVLSVLSVLLLGMAYFMLVAPDASYITIWLNDVMGLTDAAYRAHLGRVPSIDFHSTYGAAVYYAPALGFKFGFQAGAALSFGHLVVAAILLPLAVLASYRRIATFPATIFVVFLFLLISVPQRIGGPSETSATAFSTTDTAGRRSPSYWCTTCRRDSAVAVTSMSILACSFSC